jgi:hypothetical protein
MKETKKLIGAGLTLLGAIVTLLLAFYAIQENESYHDECMKESVYTTQGTQLFPNHSIYTTNESCVVVADHILAENETLVACRTGDDPCFDCSELSILCDSKGWALVEIIFFEAAGLLMVGAIVLVIFYCCPAVVKVSAPVEGGQPV